MDVWITKLTVSEDGEFEVTGATYSYSAIGHFIIRLEAMPQLNDVALGQAQAQTRGSAEAGSGLETRMRKDFKIKATTSLLGATTQSKASGNTRTSR